MDVNQSYSRDPMSAAQLLLVHYDVLSDHRGWTWAADEGDQKRSPAIEKKQEKSYVVDRALHEKQLIRACMATPRKRNRTPGKRPRFEFVMTHGESCVRVSRESPDGHIPSHE